MVPISSTVFSRGNAYRATALVPTAWDQTYLSVLLYKYIMGLQISKITILWTHTKLTNNEPLDSVSPHLLPCRWWMGSYNLIIMCTKNLKFKIIYIFGICLCFRLSPHCRLGFPFPVLYQEQKNGKRISSMTMGSVGFPLRCRSF